MLAFSNKLEHLSSLTFLNLGSNKISSFFLDNGELSLFDITSVLSRMAGIQSINLSNNELSIINLNMFTLPHLKNCNTSGNSSLKQPPAFMENKSLLELKSYALEQKKIWNRLKIALVGDAGVGKTVLTYRLTGNDAAADKFLSFNRDLVSKGTAKKSISHYEGETRGIHHAILHQNLEPDRKGPFSFPLKFYIWDYAGQTVYRDTHSCFFSQDALYLLTFDLEVAARDKDGFKNTVTTLLNWLRSIMNVVKQPVCCLVGTKLDVIEDVDDAADIYHNVLIELRESAEKDKKMLDALPQTDTYDYYSWLVDGTKTFSSESILKLQKAILVFISQQKSKFNHFGIERANKWFDVEDLIQKLMLQKRPIPLSYSLDFLCDEMEKFNEYWRALSREDIQLNLKLSLEFLSDTGMILWYRKNELLKDKIFYNPSLITDLLKILIEPKHLENAWSEVIKIENCDPFFLEELGKGRLKACLIEILWKESVGKKTGLKNIELRKAVLTILQQLQLATVCPFNVKENPCGDDKIYIVPLLTRKHVYNAETDKLILRQNHEPNSKESNVFAIEFYFGREEPPSIIFQRLVVALFDDFKGMVEDLQIYYDCLSNHTDFELSKSPIGGDYCYRMLVVESDLLRRKGPTLARIFLIKIDEILKSSFRGIEYKKIFIRLGGELIYENKLEGGFSFDFTKELTKNKSFLDDHLFVKDEKSDLFIQSFPSAVSSGVRVAVKYLWPFKEMISSNAHISTSSNPSSPSIAISDFENEHDFKLVSYLSFTTLSLKESLNDERTLFNELRQDLKVDIDECTDFNKLFEKVLKAKIWQISGHGNIDGFKRDSDSSERRGTINKTMIERLVSYISNTKTPLLQGILFNCCCQDQVCKYLIENTNIKWLIYWDGEVENDLCVEFIKVFYWHILAEKRKSSVDVVKTGFEKSCSSLHFKGLSNGSAMPCLVINKITGVNMKEEKVVPMYWNRMPIDKNNNFDRSKFAKYSITESVVSDVELIAECKEDEISLLMEERTRKWAEPKGPSYVNELKANSNSNYANQPYIDFTQIDSSFGLYKILNYKGQSINFSDAFSEYAGQAEKFAMSIIGFDVKFPYPDSSGSLKLMGKVIHNHSGLKPCEVKWITKAGKEMKCEGACMGKPQYYHLKGTMIPQNICYYWGINNYQLDMLGKYGLLCIQAIECLSSPQFQIAINSLKDAEVYRLYGLNYYKKSCGHDEITANDINPSTAFSAFKFKLENQCQVVTNHPNIGDVCGCLSSKHRISHMYQFSIVRDCRVQVETIRNLTVPLLKNEYVAEVKQYWEKREKYFQCYAMNARHSNMESCVLSKCFDSNVPMCSIDLPCNSTGHSLKRGTPFDEKACTSINSTNKNPCVKCQEKKRSVDFLEDFQELNGLKAKYFQILDNWAAK